MSATNRPRSPEAVSAACCWPAARAAEATADTLVLVKAACWGARRIWRTGFRYSKAGLMTVDLVAPGSSQRALFGGFDRQRGDALMSALDRVNARWGRGTLRPATAGFERSRAAWDTKFEMRSPRYTTRLDELSSVAARQACVVDPAL